MQKINSTTSWCYGLVEEADVNGVLFKDLMKRKDRVKLSEFINYSLTVAEIYFYNGKPFMYAPIGWSDIRSKILRQLLAEDISDQLLSRDKMHLFSWRDFE